MRLETQATWSYLPFRVAPASISPFFVNSVPPFWMTPLPVLVTGIQRYIRPVSAREGVRLMDRCCLQPVESHGDKHRQAKEDPHEGWWSEHPAIYLVLHLHCLLLLKSTSVFAIPQCLLTFQVKKSPS